MRGKDVFCSAKTLKKAYYTTKYTMVVYDIRPVFPGHSLIIPRRHVTDLTQLTEKEIADILKVSKKVIPVLLKLYKADASSYSLTVQIGKYSGMSIEHVHIHVMPRKKNDILNRGESEYEHIDDAKKISEREYDAEVGKLRMALKNRRN